MTQIAWEAVPVTISFDLFDATNDAIAVPPTRDYQRVHPYQNGIKRMIDLTLILIGLPVIVPVLIAITCALALQGQPPIYIQKRLGRGGRVFSMFKFRTMVSNPDDVLRDHLNRNPSAAKEWRHKQKLTNDPRVTPLGRILRRSSLDELPQVLNVLMGDMALVGPRPMLVDQRAIYPGRAYFRMRPGITGPWQVSKRNQSEFAARAGFDAIYDLKQGVLVDLGILMRTVSVVLRQTGC